MFSSRLLPLGCLFALVANGQDSSSSQSLIILTGSTATESMPTGSYLSYSSTITVSPTASSSAISTSVVVSTITSGSLTRTTTLGTMTIFGIEVMDGNSTGSGTASQSTNSQIILSGRPHTTTKANGTAKSISSTSTSSSAEVTNTTPCNNYPEFCSRTYGNITEVAAHNSPFVRAGNAAANQALSVTTQLNDGIRLLQGQMHFVNSTPHFCHTSCDILDSGPITTYLSEVYSWVSTHPYDVVTIILENGDYAPVTNYVPFLEQTNLIQYAYLPPKIPMAKTDWPTLGSMILTGKRVIFFMDYEANQTAVPYVLDEFSQMFETPFDPTNRSFPCTAQRPPNLSFLDASSRLYMTNHNLNYDVSLLGISLLVPNIPLLNVTNNVTGFGSLGLNAQQCNDTWDYPPKFLNVDYYNVGNGSVFEVAATYNNVTYNRACCGLPTSGALVIHEASRRSAVLLAVCVVGVSWMLF